MSKKQPRKELVLGFTLYQVLFFLLLFIPTMAIAYKIGRSDTVSGHELHLNLFTEFLGVCLSVIVTVLIIDRRNRQRDELRREQDMIDRLLRNAVSPQTEVAQKAFFDMWKDGLVFGENGILRGQNLYGACPSKVTLNGARMDGAIMTWSDFSESGFDGAILDNACLGSADLEKASFRDASLKNANLENADLSQATLIGADLTGANLLGAKIYLNNLYNYAAEWPDIPDTETPQAILPDGTLVTANTDMASFTDENYPDQVWRSEDPNSPAYRVHFEERLARLERMSKNRPSNLRPPYRPPTDPT